MAKKLIKNAKKIITMDQQETELEDGSILIEAGEIVEIGQDLEIEKKEVDEVIDAKDKYVFPGLINTHHHFYQTLTRCIKQVQNVELFDWLKYLYPIWANLDEEAVYISTKLALAELLKTGCTTSLDHHYVFPQSASSLLIDRQFEAAADIGARFHASRGSMSLSVEDGGLPPASVVQAEAEILADSEHLINKYHQQEKLAMRQIVLAPCSPFSVTEEIMVETVELAREYGISCHTHLAETKDETDYCQEKVGLRPLEFMAELDWLGEDIFFAHGVHFTEDELDLLAETNTGVAHCPVSNQKLASGIARVPEMLAKDIRVGLAVDGSASNDSSNMLAELKAAFLLHRVSSGIKAVSARDILKLATKGSAQLLNRSDIGSLEVGKAADLFMVDSNRLGFAGTHDPVSALITCGSSQVVDLTMVNGEVVVKSGRLVNLDEEKLSYKAGEIADKLLAK